MRSIRFVRWAAPAALALVVVAGAEAQEAASSSGPEVYRREVFQYQRAGRPDPFRSLLGTAELGVRFEDLALRGVIHNPEAGLSVAFLEDTGTKKRIRARVGDRVGGITILGIYPRRVDLQIDELGLSRRESLQLMVEKGPQS
jgi:hypothetical protein